MSNLISVTGLSLDLESTYRLLSGSYRARKEQRVKDFLESVDLCYERMDPVKQVKLNDYVHSTEGKKIMADYAEAILHSPSDVAKMAMAMLYCKDPDFTFSDAQIKLFISAMMEMTDDLIEFFFMAMQLKKTYRKPFPYSKIGNEDLEDFEKKGWGVELIFVYVQELIERRLLLSDKSLPMKIHGEGWILQFAISENSSRFCALLSKAKELHR